MSDRPSSSPGHGAGRTRPRAGRGGMPSYRPVRSPLVSMGPSLVEERRRHRSARHAAVASVAVVAVLAVLVWGISLLGREVVAQDAAGDAARSGPPPVLPAGRPVPQKLAGVVLEDEDDPPLTLELPIKREAITGIGYLRRRDPSALELEPEGTRANTSWGRRVFGRFLTTEPKSDLAWFQLGGGVPNVVMVGAQHGTDVYAPLDGTVVAIADYVVDGEARGVVVQLQPLGDGETIVGMRNLDLADEGDSPLAVGQTVSRGATRVGFVRDMEGVVDRPLASYTHDDGSGVEIFVRRADVPSGPQG